VRFTKYYQGDDIKEDKVGMGEKRNVCEISVGIPEGKKPVGRPTRRLKDNIRMDVTEVGWEDVDWIHLALHRDQWRVLVNTVMNLRVP
jgi:hypothetical protein